MRLRFWPQCRVIGLRSAGHISCRDHAGIESLKRWSEVLESLEQSFFGDLFVFYVNYT